MTEEVLEVKSESDPGSLQKGMERSLIAHYGQVVNVVKYYVLEKDPNFVERIVEYLKVVEEQNQEQIRILHSKDVG